jgi:pimeloyl-ACP methyl ester carboxylesterase
MPTTTTHTLAVPGAVLTYDIREPDRPGDHPPLFIFGSPMGASGFEQLALHFDDRVVITYDPRMTERSHLEDGGAVSTEIHADDLHRVAEAVGLGPVDAFGSSGGAVSALPWVVAHPAEIRTFVAHEPPLAVLLEDADILLKVNADIVDTYWRRGFGPAMAKFIQLVSHPGPLPSDYLEAPDPDPAQFGLPTEDDGSRDDALLAYNMAMPPYTPDAAALTSSGVRIVPAVGAEGEGAMARRGGEALARLLGTAPVIFPGDHGGFAANEWTPDNDPAAFAATLREVLDGGGRAAPADGSLAAAETELQRAQLAGDVTALGSLLHADVVYVGPDGAEYGKAQDLESHSSGQLRLSALEQLESVAREFGSTGITRARVRISGHAAGQPFEAEMVYTRTWLVQGGGWQVIQAQGVSVAPQP